MAGLMELLQRREEVARARVEELRGQAARLAVELAAAEEVLNRLVVTRETIEVVLGDAERDGDGAAPEAAGSPVGVLLVPHRTGQTPVEDLPVAYRDVMEVLARTQAPQQAKDVAAAVGLGTSSLKAEGMRSKLNRLADRGWITKTGDGRFTLDAATRALVTGSI